jgi:hypothetical protein
MCIHIGGGDATCRYYLHMASPRLSFPKSSFTFKKIFQDGWDGVQKENNAADMLSFFRFIC